MGRFLNPGNDTFYKTVNSEIYVDKTGLLSFLNKRINTEQNLICSSRPRRFGKSIAVKMITAYYSLGCNSTELFKNLDVSKDSSFEKHINKYDLIRIDVLVMCDGHKSKGSLIDYIQEQVIYELKKEYSRYIRSESDTLSKVLTDINIETGKQFIIVIDEWDAVFRLYKDDKNVQKEYIDFLRSVFKGIDADQYIALAYITGILPIKKFGTQSALNNFDEFTMIQPRFIKDYIGFTDKEVKELCQEYNISFEKVREWYDGYVFKNGVHVYNPKSVIDAVMSSEFASYWTRTETFESLKEYICMNFEGLKDDVIKMLAGERVSVSTGTFANDIVSFASRDDVLTALIHLGYLAYDFDNKQVYIPNKEIQEEFVCSIKRTGWNGVVDAIEKSKKLLLDTINLDNDRVAEALEKIHDENISILKYNDENALSLAITLAYYSAKDEYVIFRELPSGKGFADVVFVPKKESQKPAIIVELKYDSSAQGAIEQVHERKYVSAFENYVGKILLVGINYIKNPKENKYKKHECIIEEWTKE